MLRTKKLCVLDSRDCVAISVKGEFVILSEVKNLTRSLSYKTEILLLEPQNDIATQSLNPGNASGHESWQECGQKKLDGSTFVG